jgi:hypothetical protein
MKLLPRCLFFCGLLVGSASLAITSQTVIDATAPIRDRMRNPTAGHTGSIGRKMPIQVAVNFPQPQADAEGRMEIAFTLTNNGEKAFTIPASPHPGDLEPMDKSIPYALQHLHLYLTSNRYNEATLGGGANLYGNAEHPETLLTLSPGASVRVLARVKVPPSLASNGKEPVLLIGHAVLNDEKISTVNDKTFTEIEEIGAAKSTAYKAEWLGDATR